MKTVTDQTSTDREKAKIKANQKREQAWLKVKSESGEAARKREQLFMEHELKRQKMLVDANATLQQEKLKMGVNREVANLEALERTEAEFQQLQEKERERARDAQLKLRELAAQELKERLHVERELVKQQQQQNLLLQKQGKIDRLEMQLDRNFLYQVQDSASGQAPRGKLAQIREDVATPSLEVATVELTDSDSPPPSQNRPKPAKRILAVVGVRVHERPAGVSESIVSNVAAPVVSPALGVATG